MAAVLTEWSDCASCHWRNPALPPESTLRENISSIVRAFLGPRHTWSYARNAIRLSQDFDARLDDLFSRVSEDTQNCDERPVFIFSAGWRSGSTLLQRMLMQNNENIVMWGEPFHLCHIFDGLANQFSAFTPEWPDASSFLRGRDRSSLSDQWVANLYPDVDDLIRAHREFLHALFVEPAVRVGASLWGVKVVRLSITHAKYLKKLYPRSKSIFLCRDPVHSYASYRKVFDAWFERWPDKVVATPYAFGKHWARLTEGFLAGYRAVEGVFVRYEDLDIAEHVERLSEYLGWQVSQASSMTRIVDGGAGKVGQPEATVPYLEKKIIRSVTSRVRRLVRYAD